MSWSDVRSHLQHTSWLLDSDWNHPVPRWTLITAAAGLAAYWYYRRTYSYFEKRGIPGPTPLPGVGTLYGFFKEGLVDYDIGLVSKYGKIIGLYESGYRTLLVSDPEILSSVFVKEFHAFTNRSRAFNFPDNIVNNMLSFLEDEHWKRVRSLLTPTFSSGKLKNMTEGINVCAQSWKYELGRLADMDEEFDIKEACGYFTMDLTARTAFGIHVNSHRDPHNDFLKYGKKSTFNDLFNYKILIGLLAPALIPPLVKLGLTLFDKDAVKFFSRIVEHSIKSREKGDKRRQDFIQLMANAHDDDFDTEEVTKEVASERVTFTGQSGHKKGLTKYEVLAQGFLFFTAGYENISNSLSLFLYCLATHEDCQSRAQREIDQVVGDKDAISYNDVKSMVYLDQCLHESLRRYTLAFRTERMCGKDIELHGLLIEAGTVVSIPVHAIHMDPHIWTDPESYNPDRFGAEERCKHSPFDYMPFGYGPRNCIAMRLALLEMKLAAANILKSYNLRPCHKTQIPLKFTKIGHGQPENGIWLKVERR